MFNNSNNKENISPLRYVEWAFDKLSCEITPHLQLLRKSSNLTPDELWAAHTSLMHIYAHQASLHNLAELFATEDAISPPKYFSYDTKQFLETIVNQISKTINSDKIFINTSIQKGCGTTIFDARRLSLIIYNLVSNSIIHSRPKNKVINLNASLRGDNLIISVSDNGSGIPLSKRKNLFSAYENAHLPSVISKTGGGYILNGLGLTVSQKLAKEMRGEIRYIPSTIQTQFEISVPQTGLDRLNISETIAFLPDAQLLNRCLATACIYLSTEK